MVANFEKHVVGSVDVLIDTHQRANGYESFVSRRWKAAARRRPAGFLAEAEVDVEVVNMVVSTVRVAVKVEKTLFMCFFFWFFSEVFFSRGG
jgi:hypothetical protein